MNKEQLKKEIFEKIKDYYNLEFSKKDFIPGQTLIPASGKVFDEKEMISLTDSVLDFWLTEGRFSKEFERKFSDYLGIPYTVLVNSGSSANLLAITVLTSFQLKDRRLKPGDEVITVAAAFPTTVNPIIQNNCVPVFIDIDLETLNIDVSKIEQAITEKTKAIFIAHSLGNPFDLEKITELAKKHNLWLIEDACDGLGGKYNNKFIGTFGDISTFSFYPAHMITMGEGGALVTKDFQLKTIIRSFRDWGRACWCDTGCDNTCGKRFGWQMGELPFGYDHKYTFSHLGYNLKITDLQAAVAVAQMDKLPEFVKTRQRNFQLLYEGLKKYDKHFILAETLPQSEPCWFGFPITVKEGAGFQRPELINFLEENKIMTRMLFCGNIIRQPYFEGLKYRVFNDLKNTDYIMNNTFWIGVYPAITEEMINYILNKFEEFVKKCERN